MSAQLGPGGHIPLNNATLEQMSEEERLFWQGFLIRAKYFVDAEKEKGSSFPYTLPPRLFADLRKALTVYDGEKYCQVNQILGIFGCRKVTAAAH